jgi:uncharacterized Ntn-hydrolase superfamily protein
VQSKFPAVGSIVPWAEPHVGAIATQAYANPRYGPEGLRLLRDGLGAEEVVARLVEADDGREHRQVGVVDAVGGSASYTGSECLDWAGGVRGDGYAVQGNILVGPEVVEAMEAAWVDGVGTRFPDRLLAALVAGDRAGGDRRGRQSAALLVASKSGAYTPGDDVAYDLRVDDHADPCAELSRLLDLHHVYFDRPDEGDLVTVDGALADEVHRHLAALGYDDLETWVGVENYEMRMVDGRVDRFVLDRLREAAARRST